MWTVFYGLLCWLIAFSFKVKNLQEKWRDMFDLLDVNNDSLLDMVDVSLSKDNYVRLHNLTEIEVCGYRNMIHIQDSKPNTLEVLVWKTLWDLADKD